MARHNPYTAASEALEGRIEEAFGDRDQMRQVLSAASDRDLLDVHTHLPEHMRKDVLRELRRRDRRQNPFKSEAQRRKFYAMASRGEIPMSTVKEWERATKGRHLPERVNPKPCVRVLSLPEADMYFNSGINDVGALISIGGVVEAEPWFVEEAGVPALRIEFNDLDEDDDLFEEAGPDATDVKTIIDFMWDVWPQLEEGKCLIIHCLGGQSRSTAAALIGMSMHMPPEAAADKLVEIRPIAYPNMAMIRMADEQLGENGALIAAAEKVRSRFPILGGGS